MSSNDGEMRLIDHLVELRSRLMRAALSILLATIALMPFSRQLYQWLAAPLTAHMPEGSGMIAIDVASPLITPFKLVLMTAVFISIPVLIYQLWAFVAPGLYEKEKHLARPLLFSATLLFYAGCAFAYFIVFPVVFAFFTGIAPEDVTVMTDISRYLDFVLTLFFAFGIAFEVPIAIIILVALRIATPASLAQKRPYIIVGAFAAGMLLTPPDMISQTLLALPMWLLYEAGILTARLIIRSSDGETPDSDTEPAKNSEAP